MYDTSLLKVIKVDYNVPFLDIFPCLKLKKRILVNMTFTSAFSVRFL